MGKRAAAGGFLEFQGLKWGGGGSFFAIYNHLYGKYREMRNTTLQKMTLVLQNSSLYEIFPFCSIITGCWSTLFQQELELKYFRGVLSN